MKAQLLLLLAPLAALSAPAPEPDSVLEERQAAQSIDKLFKAKGKLYFGTATDQGRLGQGKNAAIIQANFGQVTPENSMKWESIERSKGQYSWGQADYLVDVSAMPFFFSPFKDGEIAGAQGHGATKTETNPITLVFLFLFSSPRRTTRPSVATPSFGTRSSPAGSTTSTTRPT